MYRPWVGVVLSLFISGSSQFLRGKWLAGICWFVGISLLKFLAYFCLASPLFPRDSFAFALFAIALAAWIVMLIQSCKPIPRFGWSYWLLFVFLVLFLDVGSFVVTKSVIRPFKIPTAGMSPTILGNRIEADGKRIDGDHIFAERYAYWFGKPQRGDIVAFRTEGILENSREQYRISSREIYLKRIAGVPGDVLSIQNGLLCNNGQIIAQPAGLANLRFPTPAERGSIYLNNPMMSYKVPDGAYFVIGDNTTNSLDSRYYGVIDGSSIIGRVSKIYLPLNRAGVVQ